MWLIWWRATSVFFCVRLIYFSCSFIYKKLGCNSPEICAFFFSGFIIRCIFPVSGFALAIRFMAYYNYIWFNSSSRLMQHALINIREENNSKTLFFECLVLLNCNIDYILALFVTLSKILFKSLIIGGYLFILLVFSVLTHEHWYISYWSSDTFQCKQNY